MQQDCSNTKALIDVLQLKGIKSYPFSFPHSHKLADVETEIKKFMNMFNVSLEEVENMRKKLNKVRQLAKKIDELTYIQNKASGFENHLLQVSLSDFNGDISSIKTKLETSIISIEKRKPLNKKLRLGYIGVPPMTADIYDFVENFNAHFVYNEVQREFTFPRADKAFNIYEQYYDYTYPYNIKFRIEELKKQIKERKLDGIIHYTQAFCYRAVEDIVFKKNLNIPILNIEGDKINSLDARSKLRLEAFLDMLLDVGGQDVKIVKVEKGIATDLDLNEKCAASCGRYLENMANVLEISADEMSQYYKNPIELNSTCAVFSESELIGKIAEGIPIENLCAGVNYSLYKRLHPLLTKFRGRKLIITGGVANNSSIKKYLKNDYEEIVQIDDPQFNGAIGCCYYGSKISRKV